ncbi:N-acetyl-anhydromuramyl-L-alanine amidase AmpD [Thermosporothrix hazakensis]|jgi:N-acetyl-anhydromuramyl-L-alanine amidase AmpD|uniref:N-acetylmuramoyl-L-alanine amidase n=2 Tax=Thermosporothrix TaxID=768650 RepID=A0A326U065_THEHA|nr:peptidoglycan recognition family protein [Thermosporothrix hazakensis]PZW23436.1 N-acetyl-anhydromuramyl-L-alanine amidase AmpD [Thermosporothrix hazakensis]BBH89782.1 hypothetical protein KTC_45330 [Thermosporothrix sp. COM3]GCE47971.1 hypothetical protein KTH_28400 [Thermosporothrix hazakensis]
MDEDGVVWIPSPNYFPNRDGHSPKWIVLHGTAGFHTAQEVGYYFQREDSQVSSHYVVGQDGTIVQCVSEKDGAWANGGLTAGHDPWWPTDVNPNNVTISIEHVKPSTDNSDELTDAQRDASFRLILHICQRHGIPMRKADGDGGITGHFSLDPVNRSRCPGPYPWDDLFRFLEEGDMISLSHPEVANYFEDAGPDRWRCKKNGLTIYGAILKFYRSFGGNGFNGLTYLGLPRTGELYPRQGTAVQRFERGIVAYDPRHQLDWPPGSGSVYLLHLSSPYGKAQSANVFSALLQRLSHQE